MQLLPGLLPLWRSTGESQLGADPRLALVLGGLDAGEQRFVDALVDPVPPSRSRRRSDVGQLGARFGVREPRAVAIVAALRTRGLVTDHGAEPAGAGEHAGLLGLVDGPPLGRTAGTAEGPAGTAQRAGDAPDGGARRDPMARRGAASVAVVGGDVLGLEVACLLVQAGVGAVAVLDDAPVAAADVTRGGYRPADVGRPRSAAALAILRSVAPRVRIQVPSPDLVVLVEQRAAVPFRSSGLQREDVPHLSVVLRELDVLVGPLVHPGHGACLRCLDLRRCEADPAWPALATQLAVAGAPRLPEAVLRAAAGLAALEALAVLDARAPSLGSATIEVGVAGTARRRNWAPHPDCGCGAHGGAGRESARDDSGGGASGSDLARTAAATLARDDDTVDEDLAAPHAPRLTATHGTIEALGA